MVFTLGQFRAIFQEFESTAKYPDAVVTYFSDFAQAQVNKTAWGTQWVRGVNLYTAHELVLWQLNQRSASAGGVPGQSGGIANTKTVGGATVGYDSTTSTEKNAGWWNLTNYGKEFFRLSRTFGAGCILL